MVKNLEKFFKDSQLMQVKDTSHTHVHHPCTHVHTREQFAFGPLCLHAAWEDKEDGTQDCSVGSGESRAAISPSNKCKRQTPQFPEKTIQKINYLSLIIQGSFCLWCPLGTKRQKEKLKQLIQQRNYTVMSGSLDEREISGPVMSSSFPYQCVRGETKKGWMLLHLK